jgi:hypothetical protein
MLHGHDVQDQYALGTYILVDGTGLIHHEDVLLFQDSGSWQVIRYVDGHGALAIIFPQKYTSGVKNKYMSRECDSRDLIRDTVIPSGTVISL